MKWYKYPFDKENESLFITKARCGAILFFSYEPYVKNHFGGGARISVGIMNLSNEWIGFDREPLDDLEYLTHCLFLTDIPLPEPEDK